MIKTILKNLFGRKPGLPFDGTGPLPEGIGEGEALMEAIDASFKRSLRIRQVDAGSCNACEWECTALTNPLYDIQRFGIDFVASPRHADLLLVTGPVSRQMELALQKTYHATPDPKVVVACGDCAIDGGVYRGSYAVASGVSNVIPVHWRIAGCPPAPGEIIQGLLLFLTKATRRP